MHYIFSGHIQIFFTPHNDVIYVPELERLVHSLQAPRVNFVRSELKFGQTLTIEVNDFVNVIF